MQKVQIKSLDLQHQNQSRDTVPLTISVFYCVSCIYSFEIIEHVRLFTEILQHFVVAERLVIGYFDGASTFC